MKAKARFLTLLIVLVGFAGFGFTTSDLNQNSTAEVIQMDDHSVSVVDTPEIDWVQFRLDVRKASKEAVAETNAKLSSKYAEAAERASLETDRFHAKFQEADAAFSDLYNYDIHLKESRPPDQSETYRVLYTDTQVTVLILHRNPRDGLNCR